MDRSRWRGRRKVALFATIVVSAQLLSGCSNSAVQKDWDMLSTSQQEEICNGVAQFGADTAAGLEYTLNSEYTKDDLADFLRGQC